MKFGYKEMREFSDNSDDPRVKSMMTRIDELKSKLAKYHKLLQETIKELKDERDRLARQVREVRIVAGGTEEDLPLTHSNAAINIVDLYEKLENDEGLEIQFHSLGITVIGFHGEFERRISLSNELINHANFNILDSAIEQLLAELRGEK